MPAPARALAAALGAAVVAVLGSVAHQGTTTLAGRQGVPTGLVLALLLTLAYGVLLRALRISVSGGVLTTLGWLLVVFLAGTRRVEGDLVVPDNLRGKVWLWAGFAVLLACTTLPVRTARPRG